MDTSLVAAGAVVGAVGLVTCWIAVRTQREHRRWCAGKSRVQATVSRMAERWQGSLSEDATGNSADPGGTTVPIARFRAANGVEYEVEAPEAPKEIGAKVEVAYDPALPSHGRGVERVSKVALPIGLIVVGAALAAAGASG
jgi:hypothetical protein